MKGKNNSRELLRHAFSTMRDLKDGSIDVDQAKAHAGLLKQANNILKYELDRAISIQKYESLEIREIED